MLFALPVLLLLCLPSICGNEVTERNKEFNNTHLLSAANRPLTQRNQPKITRDDQLLSLLAARRRQIIQNRFKSHIQSIVDISNGSNNIPTLPKIIQLPNNTKSINVHLNLSDILKNPDVSNSEEKSNNNNGSTESNVINVSSPRTTNKPTRKNVEPSTSENKNGSSKQSANMPIIRNILYRRKMSYLNRKLPLDFEQIAFDTLGISEINKNPEDLIFDNEDSLQVEESSHDKLIYYDVKNNSTKKTGNNFEDSSDEMKTMSMMNKTFNSHVTTITSTTTVEETTTTTNLDDVVVILNTTTQTPIKLENKTETLYKNNTRFMSQSLYNYFRPLDVPEEEMQPFLHFGEKLPNIKPNQSTTKPVLQEKRKQPEEEIDEHMDVLAEKSVLIENKIAKINLPNQKVNAARDYYKIRGQKQQTKNTTEPTPPKHIKTVAQMRNTTRHRGFRNQTIFYQNKRSGVRQTINLKGNITLGDLKPTTIVTSVTPKTIKTTTITNKLQTENTTEIVTPSSELPETTTKGTTETTETTEVNTTPKIDTSTKDSTTISSPTTRILSTAVVTSVSIESSKSKLNTTTKDVRTTTDINDSDATVVAALSNFTLQAFQNNTKMNQTTSLRNPATVYPSISLDIPYNPGLYAHHLQYATNITQSTTSTPKTKFILRPNKRVTTTTTTEQPPEIKGATDFIIHVVDVDQTEVVTPETTSVKTTTLGVDTTKLGVDTTTLRVDTTRTEPKIEEEVKVRIGTRIGFNPLEYETVIASTTTTKPEPKIEEVRIGSRIGFNPLEYETVTPSTTTTKIEPKIEVKVRIGTRIGFNPLETVTASTTVVTTTEAQTTTTTKPPNRTFNTTMLNKPGPESELPLATLFSVTDFKKPETQNGTKPRLPGIETVISRKSEHDASLDNIHAAYILAALGFLPMMVIVIYVVRSVMKKKHKIIEDFEAEMHHDSEKKSIIHQVTRLPTLVLDTSNRWEFPRGKLRLQTLLGQGNFGQVWKAEADDLKGHVGLTRLVAVKTIKDGAGTKERDDLLKELAIMQKMGSHPNVVTLLGCCTDKEPYLLIMEYVMYGKLLTFLRDHRTRRDYYNFSDDAATLTARDLTVFAYCVVRGMEYLSSKGIIHRDLAARNILVDHNKLCKIADFGMSRDVGPSGEINEPRQPRNALPVRWMAIESLMYSVFSSKTDVWAFGVLLWEIVTLGSSPYANMSGREVMRLVCEGYRLERPSHCRPELYRVMASAWQADPLQRPTFAELREDLAAMLDTAPAEGSYVDLESFRADSTVYEIDNCTPRGNYFTVKSRFSEFECDI